MNGAEHIDVIGLLGPLWRYAKALARDETHVEDLEQDTLVSL
jgi:DNA-directed RNA polymerase specialized sigma24 family protein